MFEMQAGNRAKPVSGAREARVLASGVWLRLHATSCKRALAALLQVVRNQTRAGGGRGHRTPPFRGDRESIALLSRASPIFGGSRGAMGSRLHAARPGRPPTRGGLLGAPRITLITSDVYQTYRHLWSQREIKPEEPYGDDHLLGIAIIMNNEL